jgi:integrase
LRQTPRSSSLPADEIRALERALPADWWPLFATLVYTGLRIGEAQGMPGAELRLAERRLTVGRHQRVKTAASRRDVPLPELLAELHARWRLERPYGPQEPVFGPPYGNYQRAQRVFRAACTAAGLEDVRIHDLRHTFGVHCARAGIPLARIRDLMGHATMAMTLRYLKHCPESYLSEDAERAAASLSGARDAEAQAAAELLRGEIRRA